MEMLVRSYGEPVETESAFQALAYYQEALSEGRPYQLVMLDIDMPDMQGTEVLQQIRRLEEGGAHRAAVIMVTSLSAQDQVMTCIQSGCDDYITKPFNIDIISSKLNKLGIIASGNGQAAAPQQTTQKSTPAKTNMAEYIFNDITESLASGELALPAMPQISIKFREMIHSGAALEELAGLLKQDAVIASKLMRLANSAMYRGYEKVQSLEQAISRIGLQETEHLVMMISNQKLFAVEDRKFRSILQKLAMHSLACAIGAEALALSLSIKLVVDPFAAGLFHDIGAFALIHIIAELQKRGRYKEGAALEDLAETVQCYHAMFGAKLLEKWGFERDYIRIARYHRNLNAAKSLNNELLVVHFTNSLANSMGYSVFGGKSTLSLEKTLSAQKLGITGDVFSDLKEQIQSKMDKSNDLLA